MADIVFRLAVIAASGVVLSSSLSRIYVALKSERGATRKW